MKRVTRNINPIYARDLLESVPRACISFACDDGPQAQPIVLLWHNDRYLASIPADIEYRPVPGQEVVILIDEGIYFFDLRAIYIRGLVKAAETPMDTPTNHTWFEVVPLNTVAWDYGLLREVRDEN